MSCPDENRLAAFAAGALAGDDASELETHLSSCAECHELALALGSTRTGDGEEDDDEPIRRIGRFEVAAELGRGGMGVVFEAHDPTLDRRVAVKVVRGGSRGLRADARDRLLREARSLARLTHANVVPIYEAGVHDDELYIAMELIDGVPLDAWLEGGSRDWAAITRVFCAAGEGLAAAHESDLVHRDFKPGNVMVCGDGAAVKVVDFGLARSSTFVEPGSENADDTEGEEGEEGEGRITVTGIFVGTPAYASPEQLRGGEATAASDLFSFCVSLYEALCGARPFSGKTRAELLRSIEEGRVAPLPRSLPRRLRRLIERGLSVRPQDRPPSMSAAVSALRASIRARRQRRIMAAVATVVVAASLAAVYTISRDGTCSRSADRLAGVWDWPSERDVAAQILASQSPVAVERLATVTAALDDYSARWVAARTEACRATSAREQSVELLDRRMACYDSRLGELAAGVDVLRTADASDVTAATDIVAALPSLSACGDISALLAVSPPADREAADQLADAIGAAEASHRAGKLEEGLPLARAAVDASAKLDYKPLVARAHLVLADLEHDAGRFAPAAEAYKKALWSAVAGQDPAQEAFVAAELARIFSYAIIDRDAAADHAQHALAALERATDPIVIARVRGSLAIHYYHINALDEAHAETVKVLELTAGDEAPSVLALRAGGLLLQGRIASDRNRDLEGAVDLLREATRLRTQVYGPTHAQVASAREDLGQALGRVDRDDEALVEFRAVASIREKLAGETNEYRRLMFAAMASEDPKEIATLTGQAAAVAEATFGAEHPNVAAALDSQSEALATSHEWERAVAASLRAVAIIDKFEPAGSSTQGIMLITLANALAGAERTSDAVSAVERATAAFKADPNVSPYSFFLARATLADIYVGAEDWERGCPILREVAAMPQAAEFAKIAPEAASVFALSIAVCDWELDIDRAAALAEAEKHFALVRDILAAEDPEELAEMTEWLEKARREAR